MESLRHSGAPDKTSLSFTDGVAARVIRRVPVLEKDILSRGCGAVNVDAAADMAINILRVSVWRWLERSSRHAFSGTEWLNVRSSDGRAPGQCNAVACGGGQGGDRHRRRARGLRTGAAIYPPIHKMHQMHEMHRRQCLAGDHRH